MFNFLSREPADYPDGSLTKEETIKKILLYRQKGLRKINKTLGSMACPYEREGVETSDRSLRFFSEFGELGYFSYLIIDGYDCIDSLERISAYELVHNGKIVEEPRAPSLWERWLPVLQ